MPSGPLELRLGPSAKNSLSWSADGELAIAAGEAVHLLLPNYSEDANGKPWNELRFLANNFTDDEWPPILTPSSTDGLYLGREQRSPEIVSLDWSPPGLARHRRCALAVLTTNGILSLWLPGPEPVFASGWTRSLVINQLLSEQEKKSSADINIVAYSWSCWPRECACRLAVLTEDQICILQVEKAGTQLLVKMIATAKVMTPSSPISLADTVEYGQHGPHIAWYKIAADTPKGTGSQIIFVLVLHQGLLMSLEVPSTDQDFSHLRSQGVYRTIEGHGPIHVENDCLYFLFRNELRTLDLKAFVTDPVSEKALSHKTIAALEGWDPANAIVGFGDQPNAGQLAIMQPLGFLSFLKFSKTEKGKEYGSLCSASERANSRLAKQYQEVATEFSSEHGLDGKVRLKTTGLATHGCDDSYLATLVSVWPSEHIIYHIKANDKASLIISHVSTEGSSSSHEKEVQLPWQASRENESGKVPRARVFDVLRRIGLDAVEGQKIGLAQLCINVLLKDQEATNEAIQLLGCIDSGGWLKNVTRSIDVSQKRSEELQESVKTILQLSEAYNSEMIETCAIPGCSEVILFEGTDQIDGGRCLAENHEFGKSRSHCIRASTKRNDPARCSLTGLAIQQPYISKDCEGCKRIFLDEEKLDQSADICRIVLSEFPRCPYCNGRFVG